MSKAYKDLEEELVAIVDIEELFPYDRLFEISRVYLNVRLLTKVYYRL